MYILSDLYFILLELSYWNTFEINIAKIGKQLVKLDEYDEIGVWCFNDTYNNILVGGQFYYLEKPTDLQQVIDKVGTYASRIFYC